MSMTIFGEAEFPRSCLFYDPLRIAVCISCVAERLGEDEFRSIWKEAVVIQSRLKPCICLEEVSKA